MKSKLKTPRGMGKIIIAVVLMAAGCATAEQRFVEAGNVPVDITSITLVGKWTATGAREGIEGVVYTFEYFEGGKGIITWKGADYEGEWRITNGKVCTFWKGLRDIIRCDTIYIDDEGFRAYLAGRLWYSLRPYTQAAIRSLIPFLRGMTFGPARTQETGVRASRESTLLSHSSLDLRAP